MWLLVGGVMLLHGLWLLVLSGVAGGLALLQSITQPVQWPEAAFLLASMVAALALCGLAGLLVCSAVRLLQGTGSARLLLRRLSWVALGFYLCTAALVALYCVGATRGDPAFPSPALVVLLLALGVVAVPPVLTLVLLKMRTAA
jgi:hypothetical protein